MAPRPCPVASGATNPPHRRLPHNSMPSAIRVPVQALGACLHKPSIFTVKIVPNHFSFENNASVVFQSPVPSKITRFPDWIIGRPSVVVIEIPQGTYGFSLYIVEHISGWRGTVSNLIGSAFVSISSLLTADFAQVKVDVYESTYDVLARKVKLGDLTLTVGERSVHIPTRFHEDIIAEPFSALQELRQLKDVLKEIRLSPLAQLNSLGFAWSLVCLIEASLGVEDRNNMTPESTIDNPCHDLISQCMILAEFFRTHCQMLLAVQEKTFDFGGTLVRSLVAVFAHADKYTRTKYRRLRYTHLEKEIVACQTSAVMVFSTIIAAVEGMDPPSYLTFESLCTLAVNEFMEQTEGDRFTGPYATIVSIARGPVAQDMQEIWKKDLHDNISTTQDAWPLRRDALRRLISYIARAATVLPSSLILTNRIQPDVEKAHASLPVFSENEDFSTFDLPPDKGATELGYPKLSFVCTGSQHNATRKSGSQASVRRGQMWTRMSPDPVYVALKGIHANVQQEKLQQVYLEIVVVLTLQHPRIVPIMGIAQHERIEGIARPEGQILLVLPWYSNGEVVEFLRRLKTLGGRTRFIGKINQLLCQVAEGLAYLRQEMVIHGDLSARNILVNDNGDAIIADFGLSTYANAISRQNQSTRAGNPRWLAPELNASSIARANGVLTTHRPTFASDLFAFSMVCIELFSGKVPFDGDEVNAIARERINAGERPSWPPLLEDRRMRDIVEQCWSQEPHRRGTADDVARRMRVICSV